MPLALMMVGCWFRVWAVPGPCLVCAVAIPGLGPGGWRCWRLLASPAGARGDANSEGAIGDIRCLGVGVGDAGDVVGDATWLLLLPALSTVKVLSVMVRVTSLAVVVSVVLRVLVSLVMPTVRVLHVMFLWMAFLVVV